METSPPFGTPQLFLTDSRLVFVVLNHLRYQALNRVFGTSREQANALTVVLLLGAAESAYEAARRISATRLRGYNAGLGAAALREATLGVAGPSARAVSEAFLRALPAKVGSSSTAPRPGAFGATRSRGSASPGPTRTSGSSRT